MGHVLAKRWFTQGCGDGGVVPVCGLGEEGEEGEEGGEIGGYEGKGGFEVGPSESRVRAGVYDVEA